MTTPLGSGGVDGPHAADRGRHRAGEQRDGERHRHRHRRRERQRRRRRRAVLRRRRRRPAPRTRPRRTAFSGTPDRSPNGAHTLTARARDAAGNATLSAPVTVNVAQHELLPERGPRDRLQPADEHRVPARTAHARRRAGRKDPGAAAAVHARPIRRRSCSSRTSARPASSRASTTSRSTRTSRRITTTTSSTRSARRTAIGCRGSPPTRPTPAPSPAASSCCTRIRRTPTPSTTAARSSSATTASSTSRPASTSTPATSQLLTNPRGKIHRINPDGTVPTDNPFYDGAGPNVDSIWAYGLRNPFRAFYDAPTGRLFIGDVGGNDYSTAKEEVDLGAARRQLRLAELRGHRAAHRARARSTPTPHNGRDAAVTGGFVYRGSAVPGVVRGQLLLRRLHAELDPPPDVRRERQRHRRRSTSSPPTARVDGPYGDIVYLTKGPDGALYYVDLGYSDISGTFGVSKIRRIRYVAVEPAAGRGRRGQPDLRAGAADRELLERRLVRSRGAAAHLLVDVRRRRDLDRRQPDPHVHARPGSTRRG